jgi:hypothetical protein
MSVRIGVTGHRVIPAQPALLDQIRLAVDDAIELVCGVDPVTVVSALAEGADRLVAAEVLGRPGALLEVVLPMEPDEYEADFAEATSREEFRRLLHRARSITVAPPGESRTANFERAGHMMLDRIDVLLALWDGKPARGRGGTAEIVRRAHDLGLPVVWISTVAPFRIHRGDRISPG